jgi:hypothetical protein
MKEEQLDVSAHTKLNGIESSLVFPSSFKWMMLRVKIAGELRSRRSWWLLGHR